MRLAKHFIFFFRNEFKKFNNTRAYVRFYLSYDIKNTLKSHFRRKNAIMDVITFPVNL